MLTITSTMLREHRVCSDGILTFKRIWSLPHTFHTLDSFEQALRDNASSFDWNDGATKFEIPGDEYDTLWRSFQGQPVAKCKASAFARLFWYKFAGPQPPSVETAARAYLDACRELKNLKDVTAVAEIDVSLQGGPVSFDRWLTAKIKTIMPTLLLEAQREALENVRQRQQELHTASDPARAAVTSPQ